MSDVNLFTMTALIDQRGSVAAATAEFSANLVGGNLTQTFIDQILTAYNVTAFNPTAKEICEVVMDAFPGARISWRTDNKRQAIVDSWPMDVNDGAARRDWGFAPRYDFRRAFDEYLIPTIRERYANEVRP